MSVESNNATPPTPAIAPGRELLDPRRIAEALSATNGGGGADPRLPALIPGFDAPFFQAGLAGYSDAAMRIIARRHGCPMCITEALLDRTLLAGGRGFDKADLGDLHDNIPGGVEDTPLAGQIMGSDPREMAAAAVKMVEQRTRTEKAYRMLAYAGNPDATFAPSESQAKPTAPIQLDPTEGLGDDSASCGDDSCDPLDIIRAEQQFLADSHPDAHPRSHSKRSFEVIDVNLACPVKKIEKKARGGHWLAEPKGAIKILEAVREAVPANVVCSLKIRRSFDDTPEMVDNFHTIFNAAYDMGYSFATVHARTVEQKYVGPSRWTFLKDLRAKHPTKLIFGSGDVWTAEDIFLMIGYAGMSAVSVARGCIGNPWIFRQARQMLAGQAPTKPTIAEQRAALEGHFQLSLAVTRRFRHGEEATSKMMRKFGIRFAAHHPRAEDARLRFIAVKSTADWMSVLNDLYPPE